MFKVGDLVRFRSEQEVLLLNRRTPDKKIGLVKKVDPEVYYSYSGDLDDRVTVLWLGTGKTDIMPEFYLEKMEKE